MSNLSINIGFAIIGIIAVYLAIVFICNIIQDKLKKQYNKGFNDGMEVPDFLKPTKPLPLKKFLDSKSRVQNWGHKIKAQKQTDRKQAIAEQFCDDLQRMKRLEEDSEEFINKLKVVK